MLCILQDETEETSKATSGSLWNEGLDQETEGNALPPTPNNLDTTETSTRIEHGTGVSLQDPPCDGNYSNLQTKLTESTLPNSWTYVSSRNCINLLKLGPNVPVVQKGIVITPAWEVRIFIHNKELSENHDFWNLAPKILPHIKYETSFEFLTKIITRLDSFNVCCGNNEAEYVNFVGGGLMLVSADEQ